MSTAAVKREFFTWISTLPVSDLSEIDGKLLNLLITHFDKIAQLGSAKGARAKAVGELIAKEHANLPAGLPDLLQTVTKDVPKVTGLVRLNIGPFRGFAGSEVFDFDKKYTFMGGPNGSGKTSFCEALEYALMGYIEEADARKIPLGDYMKNAHKKTFAPPKVFAVNDKKEVVEASSNPTAYRFSFIEKNRIDAFARITATTPSSQKDRIATLFGLDAFSDFVDNFTDDFDGRYVLLEGAKAKAFSEENQKNEDRKGRIVELGEELTKTATTAGALIKELGQQGVDTLDDLRHYLIGEDGLSGKIGQLQERKAAQVPNDLSTETIDALPQMLSKIAASLGEVGNDVTQLHALSSDVNYKDLYAAIVAIATDNDSDRTVCPACKTPLEQVAVDPFQNAVSELEKLQSLSGLQEHLNQIGYALAEDVRNIAASIESIMTVAEVAGYTGTTMPGISEFTYTGIASIETWKAKLEAELAGVEKMKETAEFIKGAISGHNLSLAEKRSAKSTVEQELKKYQAFKLQYDELVAKQKAIVDEVERLQKAVQVFGEDNVSTLKAIDQEKHLIEVNKRYVESYTKLIKHLKKYRTALPSKLAAGLSEIVRDFYNTVNAHDPDFERLSELSVPTAPGKNITIQFEGDPAQHNALFILSEGHIKVLGLSILLAKAVKEGLGFIIFDDVVNAIDDDHRDGVAELLLKHPLLKDRQQIVTCHGEMFINKLAHKLGASVASKEVKDYRFLRATRMEERHVRFAIANSRHYLLKAKEFLEKNEVKDSAARCRQGLESLSHQLWKKLGKVLPQGISVKVRGPGAEPDLSTVVDGLTKELSAIGNSKELLDELKQVKEKYNWLLLNKGTHEEEDLPELEHKEVSDLLILLLSIEEKVKAVKVEGVLVAA